MTLEFIMEIGPAKDAPPKTVVTKATHNALVIFDLNALRMSISFRAFKTGRICLPRAFLRGDPIADVDLLGLRGTLRRFECRTAGFAHASKIRSRRHIA
jgi:hypothetical protein